MVFADEIRRTILKLADEAGLEKSFALSDVARALDQKNWRQLVDPVKFVADVLIREGKIKATPVKSETTNDSGDSLHFKKL